MRRITFIAVASLAAATSATLVSFVSLASEPRKIIDVSRALDSGLPVVTPIGDPSPTPPDPTPLVEQHQWIFDLRWDRGDVWLLGTTAHELDAPQPTPRVMGRFALELFEGQGALGALVERVRFDFPMLGAPEPDAGPGTISFQRQLRTRIGVVFPSTKRGTRLELVDRATGRRWSLPWPAGESLPAPTLVQGDAGSPH